MENLKGKFTVVNLGCIGDNDFNLPAHLCRSLTVVEIDAEGGAETTNKYHRKIVIQNPINDRPGKFTFRRNNFAGTCSLLEPLPGMVETYGLERYCQLLERMEWDCDTIPNLLKSNQVTTLDFLKTDVEGSDAAIIRSCSEYLGKTLFIQAELRFKPFYQTEPYFHEVVSMLSEYGYEVLDLLHIDRWKYKTPHWLSQVEGRAIWADFLFVLKPERLAGTFGDALPEAVAKQIILACMIGKRNYGEYLLLKFKTSLPPEWIVELEMLVKPKFPGFRRFAQSLRRTFRPIELLLKHQIGRSQHVSIRS